MAAVIASICIGKTWAAMANPKSELANRTLAIYLPGTTLPGGGEPVPLATHRYPRGRSQISRSDCIALATFSLSACFSKAHILWPVAGLEPYSWWPAETTG
jgi:hypothetical protein